MFILPVYKHVTMCMHCLWRPEMGVGSMGTGDLEAVSCRVGASN